MIPNQEPVHINALTKVIINHVKLKPELPLISSFTKTTEVKLNTSLINILSPNLLGLKTPIISINIGDNSGTISLFIKPVAIFFADLIEIPFITFFIVNNAKSIPTSSTSVSPSVLNAASIPITIEEAAIPHAISCNQ